MPNPNVVVIARKCGVSPSTVCRALNGKTDISAKTRAKVLDLTRKLGYVRNSAARSLRSSTRNVVACIMGDYHHELYQDKIFHLKRLVSERGLGWSIHLTTQESFGAVFNDVLGNAPAGIITQFEPSLDDIDIAGKNGVQLVGYDMFSSRMSCVSLDRIKGVEDAVRHLISSGRDRILLLGERTDSARGGAYKRALSGLGTPFRRELVVDMPFGRDLYSYGYDRISELPETVDFNAILAVNDACAIGAIRALREKNLQVPDKVAVIGFDNILV
ncbi:MAG TPA: hypothetical protein DCX07_10500, partial [Phycisphaerales bacterium]|nr:hypothetical protein [Phycisphaerales bacterium]